MFSPKDTYDLHARWWFWLPFLLALALAAVTPFCTAGCHEFIYNENGILEILQAVVAFAAAYIGVRCLPFTKGTPWLMAWVAVATLGSLYIGLEEISYGQQLFKWATPDFWLHFNDQQETNFHNSSQWFDQKPRQLLTVGIIAGGILIPLLKRYKPRLLPEKFNIIYPSGALFWIAALVILTRLAKTAHKGGAFTLYPRASEVQEFYIYYFVLLYLIMLRPKLRAR